MLVKQFYHFVPRTNFPPDDQLQRIKNFVKFIGILIVTSSVLSACKPKLIPNTSVADTSSNRKIVEFMQRYVLSVESRSVENILALVSKKYSDSAKTTPTVDDSDYRLLEEKLTKYLGFANAIHLKIHVQNIQEKNDVFLVTYYYTQKVSVKMPSGEESTTMSDVNRMTIVDENDEHYEGASYLKIVSGL